MQRLRTLVPGHLSSHSALSSYELLASLALCDSVSLQPLVQAMGSCSASGAPCPHPSEGGCNNNNNNNKIGKVIILQNDIKFFELPSISLGASTLLVTSQQDYIENILPNKIYFLLQTHRRHLTFSPMPYHKA